MKRILSVVIAVAFALCTASIVSAKEHKSVEPKAAPAVEKAPTASTPAVEKTKPEKVHVGATGHKTPEPKSPKGKAETAPTKTPEKPEKKHGHGHGHHPKHPHKKGQETE